MKTLRMDLGKKDDLWERLQKKINKPKDEIKCLVESIFFNSERAFKNFAIFNVVIKKSPTVETEGL